jgi:predicted nucleic acid-binding protein
VIVVDASVLAPALADDAADGHVARARLRGEVLVAPELIDLEVAAVVRRGVLSGNVGIRRAERAVGDLVDLPLQRVSHVRLLGRCWELRENLSIYDAAYVALAELLNVVLVTSDARLARAPGVRCVVEVLH